MLLDVDVAKKFPGFNCRLRFTLEHKHCGVFGPSGSGKSTLVQLVSGLLPPDSGRIILNGRTLFDSTAKINLPPELRRVGVVFQHALLFPHMNVEKNLFYGSKRIAGHDRHIKPKHLITALHLDHLLQRRVTHLSGGERQRVALGRAILSCPHLLLLDEPLSGLDEKLKEQIIPHLHRVFDRFSIPFLFISHSLWELQMMTEQVLIVWHGQVRQQLSTGKMARTTPQKNGADNP